MKRLLLAALGGLLLGAHAFAQLSPAVQTGRATREMRDSRLSAAHFSLPLGSKVQVVNTETGKAIEVTIRGRIPLSPHRVIDLSPSAWDALNLAADTEVRVVPPAPADDGEGDGPPTVQPRPAAPELIADEEAEYPPPAAWGRAAALTPEIAVGAEYPPPAAQGRVTVLTPEIAVEDDAPSWDGDEYPAIAQGDEDEELAFFAEGDGGGALSENGGGAPAPVAERGGAPQAQPRQPIKIVPGLPNPNTRKWYRLQVGAFGVAANADEYERRARALGFAVEREQRGSLTRVVIVGILARDVPLAAQELEDAGFAEVWVREY